MMPSHENLPRPSHPRAHRLHHALNPPLDPARNSEVPNHSSSSLGQVSLKSRCPRFKCSSTAMNTAPTTFAVSFESPGPFDKHFPPVTMPLLKPDRKSTRLNSSHGYISYAVFCLKKKKKNG